MPSGFGSAMVLIIGAAIVVIDGQVLMRHGPAYLAEAYHEPRRARQVAGLVTLFFHLVMLGVVALVASGTDDDAGGPGLLRRIGMLLILAALGHAVAVVVLSRLRRQQERSELAEAQWTTRPVEHPVAVRDEDGVLHTPPQPPDASG
jgi:protein-S-isoprenylcysteine O-methyltransferase Ste14